MPEFKESEYYESGMAQVATPRCGEQCNDPSHDHYSIRVEKPTVYLPHSCDEWVIGGRAEVEAMIRDLQAALPFLSKESD